MPPRRTPWPDLTARALGLAALGCFAAAWAFPGPLVLVAPALGICALIAYAFGLRPGPMRTAILATYAGFLLLIGFFAVLLHGFADRSH